jgi:uracil-DNA glycosylase family 4
MAQLASSLEELAQAISTCRKCARLVTWRESASTQARHIGDPDAYWARAVPGFGDPTARLLILGLAPAAHGANRTGRLFTGDRSGDFLFAALHRAGLANQPESTGLNDGLVLSDVFISAAVRCAPPDNQPTREERDACSPYFRNEIALLENLEVILVLGAFAFDALLREGAVTLTETATRPKFAHAKWFSAQASGRELDVVSSYHPSQRNVFTGLLTAEMFNEVFASIATRLSA